MASPIERACRALCELEGHPPGATMEGKPLWQSYIPEVRAVLAAIREPDHKMQAAASAQKVSFRSTSGMSDLGQISVEYESEPDKGAATVFRTMIDALLEEGK